MRGIVVLGDRQAGGTPTPLPLHHVRGTAKGGCYMTRKKKSPPPEKETLAPGVELITDRKGLAQGHHLSVQLDVASDEDIKRIINVMEVEDGKAFEEAIDIYEREAIKTLEVAGLPTNNEGSRTIPKEWGVSPLNTVEKLYLELCQANPEFGGMGLRELVKSHGYRQREDPEWFAAAIVEYLSIIRAAIRRKATDYALRQAFKLGTLVSDAKALGFFQQMGDMGPPKRKRILPVAELVRYLIRKNRKATATELWKMIPTDLWYGIRIKGYKFYRNGGRLLALGKVEGYKDWRPIGKSLQYAAFRKRVTEARKHSAR